MSQLPTRHTGKPPAASKAPAQKGGPVRTPEPAGPALMRTALEPVGAAPADILALQRRVGNRSVSRMVTAASPSEPSPSTSVIQPKLTVGAAGDAYEQEADRVAGEVMRMPDPAGLAAANPRGQAGPAQREAEEQDGEAVQLMPLVQRSSPASGFEAGPAVESQLDSRRGGGHPLPDSTQRYMEPRFGANFSNVRLHTDGEAAVLNRQLSAQAFTHGSDIYFGQGKYSPGTQSGNHLLAHELTHVVQQGGAGVSDRAQTGGAPAVNRAMIQRKEGYIKMEEGVEAEIGLPGQIKKGASLFPAQKLTDDSAAAVHTFATATNAIIHEMDNKKWFYAQVPWQQQEEAGAEVDRKKAKTFVEKNKDKGVKDALTGVVPAKKVDRGGLRHKSVSTPIFTGEPSEKDVRQGGLGDCYLLAALATVARTDPGRIRGIIKDNPDGETATIRFFRATKPSPASRSDFSAEYITVRKTLAVKKGFFKDSLLFARGNAIWPALIEKAYAAWSNHDPEAMPSGYKGTYEGIAGGSMATAWEHLTGHPGVEKKIAKDPGAPSFTVDPTVKKSQEDAMARGEMMHSPWDSKLVAGIKIHQVKPGDTLASVGTEYEMDPEVIRTANMSTFNYAVEKASVDNLERSTERRDKFQNMTITTDISAELGGGKIQLRIPATGLDMLAKMLPTMPLEDRTKWMDYLKGGGTDEIRALQNQQQQISKDENAKERLTGVTDMSFITTISQKAKLSPAGQKALEDHFAGKFEAPKGESASKYSQAAQDLFKEIRQALADKKYVGVGSQDWGEGGGNAGEDMESLPGLVGGHAYQIVSTIPSHRSPLATQMDQRWFVFLRNPWGRYGRYESGDEGPQVMEESPIAKVEITDLRRYFNNVYYMSGRPPVPPKLSPEKRKLLMDRLRKKKGLPPIPKDT